jgi:hypothetical protein
MSVFLLVDDDVVVLGEHDLYPIDGAREHTPLHHAGLLELFQSRREDVAGDLGRSPRRSDLV